MPGGAEGRDDLGYAREAGRLVCGPEWKILVVAVLKQGNPDSGKKGFAL